MVLNKAKDHWAFLEEIEAPMWIDLTLEEAKSNSQDIYNEWFRTSHLFHQCSSRQLKAAFSRAGEDSVDSDFDFLGASSPKIPSSVSRSRGKDYRSKSWRGDNSDVLLNKSNPVKVVSGQSSLVNLGSCEKIKHRSRSMKPQPSLVGLRSVKEIKPKLSFVNPKGTSNLKRSLVCDRGLIGNSKGSSLKPKSICVGLDSSSSSTVDKGCESNTGSIVTSESILQGQQKFIEVSSRTFGETSGLLSAVRITLRKSCVTRKASRVANNNNRWQSTTEISDYMNELRDRKSSSSKSSVGSSSVPGFDVKSSAFISTRKKEKTSNSRDVARMSEAPTNKEKGSSVSRVSTAVRERTFNSRRGDKTTFAKSNNKETTKLKIQTLHPKSSQPLRLNQQIFTGAVKAREKVEFSGVNRLLGVGKENATVKVSASQKSNGRKNASGSIRDQNGAKQNVPRKADKKGLAGPKEKINDRERKVLCIR